MKKIVLALALLATMGTGLWTAHAVESDGLAIGDPEVPGWRRSSKKHMGTKPGATQAESAKPAEPATPAEPAGKTGEPTKPAEPAQPAEPAKPAEPPAK